ncbi:MAG: hypothetical protein GY861_13595, partial [bacterium]|nr:hypothetical protein [bacterium]
MKTGVFKLNILSIVLLVLMIIIVGGEINAQETDTLWIQDWEGDWNENWHRDYGTWDVGIPTNVGPDSAHQGLKCAATILDGNYEDGHSTRLIRHTSFVVPPVSYNPRLRFWNWYHFNYGDWGKVQVQVVGDTIWQTLEDGYYGYGSSGGYYSCN